MSRFFYKFRKRIGGIVICIGIGIILTVIIPFWGWLFAAGCGLIYLGWYLINRYP